MTSRRQPLGRPPQISRELIVKTALELDLRTLTMRELGARLGVTHTALYHWVGGREGLMHLISAEMIGRIMPKTAPTPADWRGWLERLAWAMHDEFLAVPGFSEHVAQPHRHDQHSFERLRDGVLAAFAVAGADDDMAEQSWYIFGTGIVQWLGLAESGNTVIESPPRFDLYLDVLLRGLPTREGDPAVLS